MVLLIQNCIMDKAKLATALHLTFCNYRNRQLPRELPAPPSAWATKFSALATECQVEMSLEGAFNLVRDYYASLKL